VSYDPKLLFEAILLWLHRFPSGLLRDLSRELRVSRRTIEKTVESFTKKTFRQLREELLVERARTLFSSQPTLAIKEVSFDLGYKSPRSFARAIKRASGSSPHELRSRPDCELFRAENLYLSIENPPPSRVP
jgi:AraC-like DNA-binding protein